MSSLARIERDDAIPVGPRKAESVEEAEGERSLRPAPRPLRFTNLGESDVARFGKAKTQDPALRLHDRRGGRILEHEIWTPFAERSDARAGIKPTKKNVAPNLLEMLSSIVDQVNKRVFHFTWGAEQAGVEPVFHDRSGPTHEAIDVVRDPDGQALDPSRQCPGVLGFHDQMKMIMLHRIVGDSQLLGGGSPDLIEDHGERLGGAKIPQTTPKLDRDVCRDGRGDARSRSMRYAGLWAVGFAAGSFARAAPSGELELELRICSRHS